MKTINIKFTNLIILLVILSILNLITFIIDSSTIKTSTFEKISDNMYFLLTPIILNQLDNYDNILLLKDYSSITPYICNMLTNNDIKIFQSIDNNAINKKIYLIISNNYDSIDNLIFASFLCLKDTILFVDKNLVNKLEQDENLKFKNKLTNGLNNELKNEVILKTHLLKIEYKKLDIKKIDDVIDSRIKRAIKERSCNVILNISNIKISKTKIDKKITKLGFISSIKTKKQLYIFIGLISLIINLAFIFFRIRKTNNNILEVIDIYLIINSIFLIIYYIFSLFLRLSFKFIEYLIPIFQLSFFIPVIFILIQYIKRIRINMFSEFIYGILSAFCISFLMAMIINTLFFTNNLYWLKPQQYLTYFFYFFPFILLYFQNINKEKNKLPFYILFLVFLYILFKLRDSGFFLTKYEIYLRDYIEKILLSRFRFREFFIYIIEFIFLFFYFIRTKLNYLRKTPYFKITKLFNLNLYNQIIIFPSISLIVKFKKNYSAIFYYIVLFPFLTIINSFYHSYTPLYISFLRTILALLFGFILSFFLFAFSICLLNFVIFIKKAKKQIKLT